MPMGRIVAKQPLFRVGISFESPDRRGIRKKTALRQPQSAARTANNVGASGQQSNIAFVQSFTQNQGSNASPARETHSMPANSIRRPVVVLSALLALAVSTKVRVQAEVGGEGGRVSNGLLALYDFNEGRGRIVNDRSGADEPINLKIENSRAAQWLPGALQLRQSTIVRSYEPTIRIAEKIRRHRAISVEVWITAQKTGQSGPARIFTLSKNGTHRNFTLGQDGAKFDVRFRTDETSPNGLPSLASKPDSVSKELTHVIYTRARDGVAQIFLNGERSSQGHAPGDTNGWDTSFRLALGNEQDKSRAWLGTYHLVALYSRALSPEEVKQNFLAGPGEAEATYVQQARDPREIHFETKIAPLLADNCLECHDTASKEGGLDLSRKIAALAGGDSGEAIVAGSSADSLVWASVEADEMPQDREPLSDAQKTLLKAWLEDGATWSLDMIDPAVYAHGGGPSENWVRRLTVPEYIATVKATVGVDITKEANDLLPRDVRADGFSNTAYNLSVDLKHVEAYRQLAQIIVSRMDVGAFAGRFSKTRKFTDKNMGQLISNMGKWVLRGPVDQREVISYRGISTGVAAAGGSHTEAAGLILEAMLQSPRFLYRVEEQMADGSQLPVTEYELAARMSYILWGAPPDEELANAAEEGELFDDAHVRRQVDRMLQDPRAVTQSLRFVSEWLNLSRLQNLQPSREHFPNWDPALAEDMRNETLAVFKELVWDQKRPLADMLNAEFTHVTPRLAQHYGLTVDQDGPLAMPVRVDLTDNDTRGGILTHGSLLTVGGDHASMVTRGLLVMHELLRGVVKAPPPCVDTTPVPTKAGLTQRAIAEARIADSNCGGCHSRFEPLAFGLEKYDGLGSFHHTDKHGNKLRDDGQILIPGTAEPIAYESSSELMNSLAASDRVRQSITWKLTQFALGRPLGAADAATVNAIHQAAEEEGGTYQSLVTAIVLSDLVQTIHTEPN